mmetsp:Transcript_1030/g.3198  ORF Transcript_1030/g.3198 Transcript_1030/m.3198 type:complete len:256 (+) Transcript_1030:1728-2495(+)
MSPMDGNFSFKLYSSYRVSTCGASTACTFTSRISFFFNQFVAIVSNSCMRCFCLGILSFRLGQRTCCGLQSRKTNGMYTCCSDFFKFGISSSSNWFGSLIVDNTQCVVFEPTSDSNPTVLKRLKRNTTSFASTCRPNREFLKLAPFPTAMADNCVLLLELSTSLSLPLPSLLLLSPLILLLLNLLLSSRSTSRSTALPSSSSPPSSPSSSIDISSPFANDDDECTVTDSSPPVKEFSTNAFRGPFPFIFVFIMLS